MTWRDAKIGIVCALIGMAAGVVAYAIGARSVESGISDRVATLEACLSADMLVEASPDPCFQIRERIRNERTALSLAKVSLRLTHRVDETMRTLDSTYSQHEAGRQRVPWVRRALWRAAYWIKGAGVGAPRPEEVDRGD